MTTQLTAQGGTLHGQSWSLATREFWIVGSDPHRCDIVIHDPQIAAEHFLIEYHPNQVTIESLSSDHPLSINGQTVGDEAVPLKEGDTITLGAETLIFHMEAIPLPSPEAQREVPPAPQPLPDAEPISREDDLTSTIFEDDGDLPTLAEIDYGQEEVGRWLLKVVGGPNNGAEFSMASGTDYVLGSDPLACNIVFHDNSVSRQHARISIDHQDTLSIQDLNSRNGVMIDGEQITEKVSLLPQTVVSLGTTAFVIYDRKGEMRTIISPLLPSLVKGLQQKDAKGPGGAFQEAPLPVVDLTPPGATEPSAPPPPSKLPFVIGGVLAALLALAILGIASLFRETPVATVQHENAEEQIHEITSQFPAIRGTFQPNSHTLLLVGHVTTPMEKNQLLYQLQSLPFIHTIDDAGVVIDEYVWREANSILKDNPSWKGISIRSTKAGEFILSGYLKTIQQSEQLYSYLNLNFPYLDLLKRQVVVEEEVTDKAEEILKAAGMPHIQVTMDQGEVQLLGHVGDAQADAFKTAIKKIEAIPGVRSVLDQVTSQNVSTATVNLTGQYTVSGRSKIGQKYTVMINGRILNEGDILDGMTIEQITPQMILLHKDGVRYRIDQ